MEVRLAPGVVNRSFTPPAGPAYVPPQKQRGGRLAAPCVETEMGLPQFGTAAFGFGGNAEFLMIPRSRSSEVCSALSSFGSGGM
jgi:hypothetical protein